jgi:general stress protein CsbA
MLGGTTALGLNIMCVVRNICYMYKDKNKYAARVIPAVLALIMAIMSAFLWEGYHSIFFVVGITLNTLAMGYFNAQNLRKSILLTSGLILIYNLFIPSIGGTINEMVAISSSVIGLIRYRKASAE